MALSNDVVKNFVTKPLTLKPRGTVACLRDGGLNAIDAFFGPHAELDQAGTWDEFWQSRASRTPTLLDHGYDESAPHTVWGPRFRQDAAAFRGGNLLTSDPVPGDIAAPLEWIRHAGHRFTGSPRLVLTAGQWCPDCVQDVSGY